MSRLARARTPLLWLAALRAVLAFAAIPLAPVLAQRRFALLVLLRPTKEVLLAGGFFVRIGRAELPLVVAAAVPLSLFAVWHFFALGRAYEREIRACELPGLGGRLLPPERIEALRKVLEARGARLVVLARLAAFPSTLVAAAAGSSGMPARRFLAADGAGALASIGLTLGVGYALGAAYRQAGPWLTAAAVVALVAVAVLVTRYLRRWAGAPSVPPRRAPAR